MSMVNSMHNMDGMASTGNPMDHESMTHMMPHDSGHENAATHMSHDMTGQMHGSMSMSHSMYFSFKLPVRVLFFEWNIVTSQQLAASCIGIFLLAILYEGLKVFRQHLLNRSQKRNLTGYNAKTSDAELQFENAKHSKLARIFNGWHILQSVFQIVQTTLGMFLMLMYMTFNIWIAVSVSLGSGVGYFVFAWLVPNSPNFDGHCH